MQPKNINPAIIQRYILIDKPRIKINEIDWECTEKKIIQNSIHCNQDELDKINLVNQNLFNKVNFLYF